jgi:hypothetical protein
MKTVSTLFLIGLLIAVPLSGKAQKEDKGGKVGGIRLGYHAAALYKDGEKMAGTNNLENFYIGIFRDNKIAPLFRIGTGLEYFQNGAKIDNDNKLVLHTLSIPVNFKVKLGPVFALTGVGANFKVSEKVFLDGTSTTPSDEDKSNFFDIPFYLGAGAKIWFISIEARYHWGLLDVNEGYSNQYLQIGAAVSF